MANHAAVHEKGTFNVNDLLEAIKKQENFPKTGAICLFIGVVRGETLEGEKVQGLKMEAYEEKADEVLNQICNDLSEKPGITDVQIHHLLGEFKIGDELVYVAVAGSHRTQVFPVLREAVERYKSEAPIFKKEQITDEKGVKKAYWVSEKDHKIA